MTTLNLQIGVSSGDAREKTGVVSLTNTTLNIGTSDAIGLQWSSFSVPKNATINSADTQWWFTVATVTNTIVVFGEAADSSAVFTTGTSNITNRVHTTHSMTWGSGLSTGVFSTSPDISSVVNDVTSRSGYTANGIFTLLVPGAGTCTIEAWDGNTSEAAKLDVTYTGSSVVTQAPFFTLCVDE